MDMDLDWFYSLVKQVSFYGARTPSGLNDSNAFSKYWMEISEFDEASTLIDALLEFCDILHYIGKLYLSSKFQEAFCRMDIRRHLLLISVRFGFSLELDDLASLYAIKYSMRIFGKDVTTERLLMETFIKGRD